MEKNSKTTLITEAICIIAFSVIFTTLFGGSLFIGDMNMIDEGQFAAWANNMLHGKKLYSDIYSTYGPLLVYPLYWLFLIFEPSAWLTRLYLISGSIIGIFAALWFGYIIKLSRVSRLILVVLLSVLPVMSLRQGAGLIALCVFIQAKKTDKTSWFFATGIFVTLTTLISLDIGIFTGTTIFLTTFFDLLRKGSRNILRGLFLILLGILVACLVFIWSAGRDGWLIPYLSTQRNLLSFQGIDVPNGQNFPNAFVLFPKELHFISFLRFLGSKEMLLYWTGLFYSATLSVLIVRFFMRTAGVVDRFVSMLCVFGLFLYTILLTRNGIGHYFFTLSPVFLIGLLLVQQCVWIFKNSSKLSRKVLAGFIVVLFAFFIFRLMLIHRPHILRTLQVVNAPQSIRNNPARVGPLMLSREQMSVVSDIQSYVSSHVNQDEYVFFFHDEPMMYMLVDRKNPTRYDLPFIANTLEKRLELLASLKKNPPQYIFENRNVWAVDGISNKQRLPEIVEYMQENYKKIISTDEYIIYQKRK